jgi:hypothetical protein
MIRVYADHPDIHFFPCRHFFGFRVCALPVLPELELASDRALKLSTSTLILFSLTATHGAQCLNSGFLMNSSRLSSDFALRRLSSARIKKRRIVSLTGVIRLCIRVEGGANVVSTQICESGAAQTQGDIPWTTITFAGSQLLRT